VSLPDSPEPVASSLLDALFQTPACGYCLVNPAGRVVRANDEWLRSTGFRRDQVVGYDIIELFPGTQDMSRALHDLARSSGQVHVPKHAQTLGGRETWWEGWLAPIPFDPGTGLLITAREIRDEWGVSQESGVHAIFDSIEDVIYAKDTQGRMVYANPGTTALIGRPLESVIGRTDAEFLLDAKAAQAVMQTDRAIMDSGEPAEVEEHVPSPDGSERVWLSRKVPWRSPDGRVLGLLGISRDITARKLADRELGKMRGLMQSTLDNFPTAITFKDLEGRFIEVNGAVQRMFGRPRHELIGLAAHDFLPPHQAETIRANEAAVLSTGTPLHVEQEREVAGRKWVFLDTIFPLTAPDGSVYGVGYISHDLTAQKRYQHELNEVNQQLVEAGRQKDQFIATLGHELRNPLAPIRTAAELIRLRRTGDPAIERPVEIIRRQAEHLTRLVDDLLDVSRVTFGDVQLKRETVDLASLAVSASEALQGEFAAKGIAFELRIADGPRVLGDAARLAQCMTNLLANAAKFTSEGGSVQLRVRRDKEMAVFEVQDSGAGFDPVNAERIFELFVQEHRSGLHGNKGLGIGLALTRRLVTLHGGTVMARSGGPGTGSLFTVRLPLFQMPEHEDDRGAQEAGTDDSGAPEATVIVVDDNEDAAETIAELLRMSGFSTRAVYSGEAALAHFTSSPADALILDIGLPGIDGYEVARRIRALAPGRQPVLIALTGWGQEGDRANAMNAGFDEHLTKPADVERLLAVLMKLLAGPAVSYLTGA
jgi:PAS domain S-box-containing protein